MSQLNEKLSDQNSDLATISEIIRFSLDTKFTHEEGEQLLDTFGDPIYDGLIYQMYRSERREELLEIFLNYQKQYTKEKLAVIYSTISLTKESSDLDNTQNELYLNVAEKLSRRTNVKEIFKYINTIEYAMLRAEDNQMGNSVNIGLEFTQNLSEKGIE